MRWSGVWTLDAAGAHFAWPRVELPPPPLLLRWEASACMDVNPSSKQQTGHISLLSKKKSRVPWSSPRSSSVWLSYGRTVRPCWPP